MDLKEWCNFAWQDQSAEEPRGHIYGNYRYCGSRGIKLITDAHIRSFAEALASVKESPRGEMPDSGYGAYYCREAGRHLHLGPCGSIAPKDDFRLMSEPIEIDPETVFFNLRNERQPTDVSSEGARYSANQPGSGALGRVADDNIPAKRLLWLVDYDSVRQLVASNQPKSGPDLIGVLADYVGLVVWGINGRKIESRSLRVYKPLSANVVFRPHAFSGGLGNAFSAFSEKLPYGQTVRATTGELGLPEAIGRCVDFDDITEKDAGKEVLDNLLRTCGLSLANTELTAELSADALEPAGGYRPFMLCVLRRLGFYDNFFTLGGCCCDPSSSNCEV